MTAFKFTFLVFATLLVFQVHAKPESKIQSVKDIDLVGLLKKIVEIVEKVLDQVISTAESLIDNVNENTWDDVRSKVVSIANDVIGIIIDRVLVDVDKMGQQSTPAGKKLADCVVASRDDILALPITFGDDALKCIGTDVITLVKDLGPIVKDLEGVHQDAKAAADKINGCEGNDIEALLCVAQVASDLLNIVAEIPDKVKDDVAPALDAAKTFLNTLIKCNEDELPVYFANAGKLVDKVATCVAA